MRLSASLACVMVLVMKRSRNRSELERHNVSAEQLESLMASGKESVRNSCSAAGRLVVKECIMLGAAILTMAHAAKTYVNHQ